MPKKSDKISEPMIIHHAKTADADLTEFRRVLGSIALTGPVPSKYFLDEAEEQLDDRARD